MVLTKVGIVFKMVYFRVTLSCEPFKAYYISQVAKSYFSFVSRIATSVSPTLLTLCVVAGRKKFCLSTAINVVLGCRLC